MPGFASRDLLGISPAVNLWAPDTTQRHLTGTIIKGDDAGWWGGGGEFMYVKATATIAQFACCLILPVFNSTTNLWEYTATEIANTANLGRPVGVAMQDMVDTEYGWLQISGTTPIKSDATVAIATGVFGVVAAGTVGASAAGKQILNAFVCGPATITVAKAGCVNVSGSTLLNVPNADGWFPGVYLSGTGVGAGARVSSIDVNNRVVTMSAVSTAAIAGTVTATYNNATIFYNVVHLNRSFLQGRIT
jgi:hypothetical protein